MPGLSFLTMRVDGVLADNCYKMWCAGLLLLFFHTVTSEITAGLMWLWAVLVVYWVSFIFLPDLSDQFGVAPPEDFTKITADVCWVTHYLSTPCRLDPSTYKHVVRPTPPFWILPQTTGTDALKSWQWASWTTDAPRRPSWLRGPIPPSRGQADCRRWGARGASKSRWRGVCVWVCLRKMFRALSVCNRFR